MRVLTTGDAVGGVWTYALELAGALEPHGVEVHLATMGPRPDAGQRAEASAVLGALHESDFALEWEPDPWADVEAACEWLLDLAAELRPDVIHLNGYAHSALGWEAPVVVAAHSDVVSWWRAVKGEPAPARLDEYRRRVTAGLEAADAVCAPTRAVLEDLRRSFGYGGRCTVVPNGRRAQAAPAAKEPLVAGLGRFWDEAKNVGALQRVAGRVAWPIELAGPGTPRGRVGPDEARALLARAAVFASPARYEPFGLAALEAAQAGCALVLGDIPSLREVWGGAAVYVPPDDDEALVRALDGLAEDEQRLRDLARRARERASRYTPEVMGTAMLAVYERVLAPTGAAA